VVIDIVLPAVFRPRVPLAGPWDEVIGQRNVLVRVGESSIIANGNELKWLGNVSSELFGVRRLDFDHFDGSEGDV